MEHYFVLTESYTQVKISFRLVGLLSSLRVLHIFAFLIDLFINLLWLISACRMQAIGVASNDILPDASFSASSESTGFEAFKGRLHAAEGWSPGRNDRPDDYLQIDLQVLLMMFTK